MILKKLVIISHTEHYQENGVIKGWGPTVNEINFLSAYWTEVVHVACLYHQKCPSSCLPYATENIKFVRIPPFGGKGVFDKILILVKIPKIILQVIKSLKNATEVQLRLPTSIGLFLLPLFALFIPRKFTFWIKYAGNWGQVNPSLSYKIQRWWLQKNYSNCKVTINGFWQNQAPHIFSFENPCLTKNDIILGKNIAENKIFKAPFNFVFIGRLDAAKGMNHIIAALKKINIDSINEIHFVGDAPERDFYENECAFLNKKVNFHGFLDKNGVHEILKTSHFILLPSISEGFPKVVAEAACYGVLPIVSNVGSIPHYINDTNGFVWDINGKSFFNETIKKAIQTKESDLQKRKEKVLCLAEKFTFADYYAKLAVLIDYDNRTSFSNK